ncbi:hypothetical protein R3P88_005026 [Salmonella enterica]|uniref:hypothetical protein n=1 Tax=Salmonella enterica TaxID=28901 RepID=UPI0014111D6E|nr:hypothetical protein [Salmonella enterica subsp. diarizonae]EEB5789728.1 hypothetical protein [Salmonella enterica]EDQ0594529.1 hypothetical protein [Salmonella enterica subsp. diarizonae]EDR0251018.1 hypothetical protein [Salmonella enterica subsp. diarizonae]EDS9680024.1 hypothetical protein [Salmonella enterica subsp. diarizonae]
MLQTKQVHVLYTAEKVEKLYSGMSAVADDHEAMADGVTGWLIRCIPCGVG